MGKDPYAFRACSSATIGCGPCSTGPPRRPAGDARWRRARPGDRDPQRVQGRAACCGRDRLPPATVNRAPRRLHRPPGHQGHLRGRRRAADQPAGLQAQMMGGIMDGIAQVLSYSLHLQDSHFSRAAGTTPTTRVSGTRSLDLGGDRDAADDGRAWRRGEFGVAAVRWRPSPAPTPGHGDVADRVPAHTTTSRSGSPRCRRCRRSRSRRPTACAISLRRLPMPSTRSSSTASRSTSIARETCACSGSCAICSACTGRSTAAGSGVPGLHEPLATATRSTPARCRSARSSRPTRSPRSRASSEPDGPASDAAGVARARRRPVRLLPAGPDHDGRGQGQPAARRGPRSPTPTSTRSATSAAAAPTSGSARRSSPPQPRCEAAVVPPAVTASLLWLSGWPAVWEPAESVSASPGE